MALFGVLTVGSCNDDEPVVSPIPGEDEEVVIPAPEPINPVLVQTLYFDFGSVGGGTREMCIRDRCMMVRISRPACWDAGEYPDR